MEATVIVDTALQPGQSVEKTLRCECSCLVITVKGAVRLRWLYSPDGTNFDDPSDAEAEGQYVDVTGQRTVVIPCLQRWVKLQFVNLSSETQAVKAWGRSLWG